VKNYIHILVVAAISSAAALVSCGRQDTEVGSFEPTVSVGGVSFEMDVAPAGAFTMGLSADRRAVVKDAVPHLVVLDTFAISSLPVGEELWTAVMKKPMGGRVSYKAASDFVVRLSKLAGKTFRLPTEAQWEYANGLGIISGDNLELCRDYYVEKYADTVMTNPTGPSRKGPRLLRTRRERSGVQESVGKSGVEFHVVQEIGGALPEKDLQALVLGDHGRESHSFDAPGKERFEVGGVGFEMVQVKGGSFRMGKTPQNVKNAGKDEKPEHEVTVSDFEIGKYEVTADLWKAVMGSLPYHNEEGSKPVVNISWYDCQQFIHRLNGLTGRSFRLPTEAEWEYAARGGRRSAGFAFSGADRSSDVSVYYDNSAGGKVQKVGGKRPNELGIYDMSGNAWEWCQDWYGPYSAESQMDPSGPESGVDKVMRGGSSSSRWEACRVSNRTFIPPFFVKSSFGFRLAL